MKRKIFRFKSFREVKLSRLSERRTENTKPQLHMIQPRGVPWRIDKTNAMAAGVLQKCRARFRGAQNPVMRLDPELVRELTVLRDQPHRAFTLMRIQLIDYKSLLCREIAGDGSRDLRRKIAFRARGTNGRRQHFSGGDFKIGNQTLCAMTMIFKFLMLKAPRFQRHRRRASLQRLNAGFFVRAHHMDALLMKRLGLLIYSLRHKYQDIVDRFYYQDIVDNIPQMW